MSLYWKKFFLTIAVVLIPGTIGLSILQNRAPAPTTPMSFSTDADSANYGRCLTLARQRIAAEQNVSQFTAVMSGDVVRHCAGIAPGR